MDLFLHRTIYFKLNAYSTQRIALANFDGGSVKPNFSAAQIWCVVATSFSDV